jgi:hypothetical protein
MKMLGEWIFRPWNETTKCVLAAVMAAGFGLGCTVQGFLIKMAAKEVAKKAYHSFTDEQKKHKDSKSHERPRARTSESRGQKPDRESSEDE